MRSHSHCRVGILLALLALLNFIPQLALAQGTAFTYNGVLQKGGTGQSGNFNFTFTLFNVASSGTAIAGPITLSSVPVKSGAFTVTLDFGGAVWNGQDVWLEIAVEGPSDSGFNILSPRQQVLPTPYAIYAETSGNVSGSLSVNQLNGLISNNQLANSTITVNTLTGISASPSPVALGGMITLNNTGVTSLTGGDGVTVSGATGDLTLGLGSTLTLQNLPVAINTANGPLLYADAIYGNYFAGIGAGNRGTTGSANTAEGLDALQNNSSGYANTANGGYALQNNSSGYANTANGEDALLDNSSGSYNTANGTSALQANASGSFNTANGIGALLGNETGSYNVGDGAYTLANDFRGSYNTALGYFALSQLGENTPAQGGSNNIAIGNAAGNAFMGNESSNIDIGNFGVTGESGITRIGTPGIQTAAYIAGIINGDGSGLVNLNGSQITSGSISSSLLANSPITIQTLPGSGLSGGQAVPLGGTIALNNTGVISLNGGDGVTVSGTAGNLSLGLGSTLTLATLPVSISSYPGGSVFYVDNSANIYTGTQAGSPASSGTANIGIGQSDLSDDRTGSYNTAVGAQALFRNDGGNYNAAYGFNALLNNEDGSYNTANGYNALNGNEAGSDNVGVGASALFLNVGGNNNTAVGYGALAGLGEFNPVWGGTNNIALGYGAGSAFTGNESSNIDIGNIGVLGESGITRIGTPGIQTAAYIAGIINGNGSGLVNLNGSQIIGGTIENTQLANSSITISPGIGVTGGGTVSLGSSVSLGATSANIPSTVVSRDGTGSFAAQNLTLAGILNLPAAPLTINSGANSLLLGDGNHDLFVGLGAGNLTSGAGDNTALGYESLQADTSGYENVAVGSQSLAANTTGIYNVGVGYLALQQNTEGFGNAAIGWEALMDNTNGWYDTGVGTWALQANTSGNNNTAVGYDALGGNTTGCENTAYGVHANLYNTTGSNNVAVGWWSLNYCSGGSSNIALGYQAGINLTGSDCQNIDIGNAGSNSDVGVIRIGTPGIHVTTSLAGICNSHEGYGCRQGTAGTVFGNTFNFWWSTNNQLQAWVDNIDVGNIMFMSDRRLKENIEPMTDDALTRVMALKPSTFKYKTIPGTIFHGDGTQEEGFIADELQQVIPSAVNGEKDALTSKGTIQPQTVNLMPVVAVLTKAVQDQQKEMQAQQSVMQNQQKEIDELKAMVKTLSAQKEMSLR